METKIVTIVDRLEEQVRRLKKRVKSLKSVIHNHEQFICRKCGLRQESKAQRKRAQHPTF